MYIILCCFFFIFFVSFFLIPVMYSGWALYYIYHANGIACPQPKITRGRPCRRIFAHLLIDWPSDLVDHWWIDMVMVNTEGESLSLGFWFDICITQRCTFRIFILKIFFFLLVELLNRRLLKATYLFYCLCYTSFSAPIEFTRRSEITAFFLNDDIADYSIYYMRLNV